MNRFIWVKLEGQQLLKLKSKIKKKELVKTKQQLNGIQMDLAHNN